MKLMLTLAACVATATIAGCSTTQSTDNVAPGAMGTKSAECCEGEKLGSEGCCEAKQCEEAAAAMGAVSENEEKSECCASQCDGEKANVSPGAVSECGEKADNGDASVCPVTGRCGEK